MPNDNPIMPFGGKADLTDEKALMQQMQEQADFGARGGDVSYMSFSGKKGQYKIGVNGRAPEPGEPWLVAVPLFKTGYICWKGGKPVSKRMAGMREPNIMQPDPEEGGPFDDRKGEGWFQARSMGARSLMNGEEIEFTINSKSGVAAIAELQREVLEQMAAGHGFWPVIEFGTESFESKGFKNDKPTLTVRKWLTSDDIKKWDEDFDPMSFLEDGDDEQEKVEAEPVKRRRNL